MHKLNQLSQLNVLVQIEHLMTYPIVHSRVAAGTLRLSGWWFDIASGIMHAYQRASRAFQVIDRHLAERMVGPAGPSPAKSRPKRG